MLSAGAHAFLARSRTRKRPRFKAGEHILERHHPCIGEHQGRVVIRHERRGRHHIMIIAPEIVEKAAADVIGRSHSSRDLGDGKACCKPVISLSVSDYAYA